MVSSEWGLPPQFENGVVPADLVGGIGSAASAFAIGKDAGLFGGKGGDATGGALNAFTGASGGGQSFLDSTSYINDFSVPYLTNKKG